MKIGTTYINTPMIVLTGGPCAGKSTILAYLQEELKARGFNVFLVSETATELHQMGVAFNCYHKSQVQGAILAMQSMKEQTLMRFAKALSPAAGRSVIICDRGIMDQQAYMDEALFDILLNDYDISRFHALHQYTAVLHLRTAALGAEDYYTLANNSARSESLEEARFLDQCTLDVWNGTPHLRIFGNEVNFEEKKRKVLSEVCNILGVPQPLEIERKWLIDNDSAKEFLRNPDALVSTVSIAQVYLKDGSRLRKRSSDKSGDEVYTHTHKTEIESGINYEIETHLTEEQYAIQLQGRDQTSNWVHKTRHMFVWQDRYWELDQFLFSGQDEASFYMLETEFSVEEMLATVDTPPFLHVVREVTTESAFKNKNIARSSPLLLSDGNNSASNHMPHDTPMSKSVKALREYLQSPEGKSGMSEFVAKRKAEKEAQRAYFGSEAFNITYNKLVGLTVDGNHIQTDDYGDPDATITNVELLLFSDSLDTRVADGHDGVDFVQELPICQFQSHTIKYVDLLVQTICGQGCFTRVSQATDTNHARITFNAEDAPCLV